jgi:hypothetical protein
MEIPVASYYPVNFLSKIVRNYSFVILGEFHSSKVLHSFLYDSLSELKELKYLGLEIPTCY